MKFLLDTHALIWFVEGNPSLSKNSRQLIENANNNIHVSIVSFYEIAIKQKINKLALGNSLKNIFHITINHGIDILPISEQHLFAYDNVPLIDTHKDPFDRLIIATALFEKFTIITTDGQFSNYTDIVNIVW